MPTSLLNSKVDYFSFKVKETFLFYVSPKNMSSRPRKTNPFMETQIQRRNTLQKFCERAKRGSTEYSDAFLLNNRHKLIYCRVPKAACTTWRRVFLLFQGYQKTLKEIPSQKVHGYPLDELRMLSEDEIEEKRKKYYSFMFSRHPHDRLFSAYRNKFMNPENVTAYLEYFGPWMVYDHIKSKKEMETFLKYYRIDKKKLKVSFTQFVRFVLRTRSDLDPHWQPQTDICKVCNFKFDHIGKFETMYEDAKVIFENIKQPEIFEMFEKGDDSTYRKKTTSMLRKYYGQLPKDLLTKINQHFKNDFEAFGYDPQFYLP